MAKVSALSFVTDQIDRRLRGGFVKNSLIDLLCCDSNNLSPQSLAAHYEKLISKEKVDKYGIVYTPPWVATEMTRALIDRWHQRMPVPPTICDPACGAGIFLLAAADTWPIDDVALFEEQLGNNLYGLDRDASAVEISKIGLLLLYYQRSATLPSQELEENLDAHIVCADSLLERLPFGQRTHFDVIISNPPYGLSRGGRIPPAENEVLKQRYRRYRLGKPNHYLLFMARTLELLNENGIASLIVPNSWLGIRSAESLRKMLLASGMLTDIETFEGSVFGDPGVEPVIYTIDRAADSKAIQIRSREAKPGSAARCTTLAHDLCLSFAGNIIPSKLSPQEVPFLARILDGSTALGSNSSPFTPLIALQAYAVGKGTPPQSKNDVAHHVFHSECRLGDEYLPYLQGRDIGRYTLQWSGTYLKHGPWLAEPQPLSRYQGARLLLREVCAPLPHMISAVVIEEPWLYNRSVLHILLKPGTASIYAWALGALLNSAIASKILFLLGRKTQRTLFPKLLNDDLKSFPLPAGFARASKTLAEHAHNLASELTAKEISSSRVQLCEDLIEEQVSLLYELDRSQLPRIAAA